MYLSNERLVAQTETMKDLLEKYFEGKTSLEEEAQLKSYFRSGQVEESLKQYQPLFQLFEKEQEVALPADFDQKLMARLDSQPRIFNLHTWQRRLLRIAAIGAVLLAAYFAFHTTDTAPAPVAATAIDWSKYEITDEQQALEETKKALRLVSEKLNRGKHKTIKEVSKAEKLTKYLN